MELTRRSPRCSRGARVKMAKVAAMVSDDGSITYEELDDASRVARAHVSWRPA